MENHQNTDNISALDRILPSANSRTRTEILTEESRTQPPSLTDNRIGRIVQSENSRTLTQVIITEPHPSPVSAEHRTHPLQLTDNHNDRIVPSANSRTLTPVIITEPLPSPVSAEYITHPLSLSYTPNGTEQWIRTVELEFMPTLGRTFKTLDEAVQFYEIYALACGFTPRLYTTKRLRCGTISKKTVVCNRQGTNFVKESNYSDNEGFPCDNETKKPIKRRQQKNKITRVGCKAKIRFVLNSETNEYVIDQLEEAHNHILCCLKYREFSKIVRHLTLYHKQMIINNSKVNIGATKTYRMSKEYAGTFENVGASVQEFTNFNRDVRCFIGYKDASIMIKTFEGLAETENFYFAYEVDGNKNLIRVFWADEIARKNYSSFGDGFSYDPTYATNKYSMVFTPFTGVDNHKKSVCFGGALIANEDEASFKWVFNKFLDAMSKKEPRFIITDQDPAIKKAIPLVFKHAKHKLCMWHICQKIATKVGVAICDESDFLSKINSVIWDNDLEPMQFEEKWMDVIREHELENNSWLNHMFSIRSKWIPAFSRDIPMGGLLRTTQRSESSNSFFKRFVNKGGCLVEFWMRFKSAMDQQRHSQKRLDCQSQHSNPRKITPLQLEVHASRVYTHAIFYEFQDELRIAVCNSGVEGFSRSGNLEISDVKDGSKNKVFQVVYNADTLEAVCNCKLFERVGQLCSHLIKVFAGKGLKEIPEMYVKKRWTKDVNSSFLTLDGGKLVHDYDENDVRKLEVSQVWSEFHKTVSLVGSLPQMEIRELCTLLKNFREQRDTRTTDLSKDAEIESLLGCPRVTEVNILPPNISSNKGSGKKPFPTAVSKSDRPARRCRNCKQMVNHDRRNCPNPYVSSDDDEYQNVQGAPDEVEDTMGEGQFADTSTGRGRRRCRNCKQMAYHDRRNCPNAFVESGDDNSKDEEDVVVLDESKNKKIEGTQEREEIPPVKKMMTRQQKSNTNLKS